MNRRHLFKALAGSAAMATVAESAALPEVSGDQYARTGEGGSWSDVVVEVAAIDAADITWDAPRGGMVVVRLDDTEYEPVMAHPAEPKEGDEFLPVFDGWHVQESAPQNRYRCYRVLAPKCKYYHRNEIAADPWLMERFRKWPEIAKGWVC